jgi:hypothetical protein
MEILDILKNNPDMEKSLLKELTYLANSIENKTIVRTDIFNFDGISEFVRPMILIQDDKFILPKNPAIADKLKNHLAKIETAIKASGRIEMLSDNTKSYVGTAWVVDKNNGIAVTNRHSVSEFATVETTTTAINNNIQVMINFKGEHPDPDPPDPSQKGIYFLVKKVLYVSFVEDIAFLQVETINSKGEKLPEKIKLAAGGILSAKKDVCLIGYPTKAGYHNEDEFPHHVSRILDKIQNVKRICPGQIIETKGNVVIHDCSTLENNSGSVLFAQDIGEAVGIHFGWKNSATDVAQNHALSASVIKVHLAEAKKYLS